MDNIYFNLDSKIKSIESSIQQASLDIESIDSIRPEYSSSRLDIYDVLCFTVAGAIGGCVSSSDKITDFLDKIHDKSSGKSGKAGFIDRLLHHSGDAMDQNGQFTTRSGEKTAPNFHRVFYGHDPLSIKSDNPFIIMTKDQPFLRGAIQVVRHLIADTFSKQGLPLPGHSYLDYSKEGGRTGNYLIDITKFLTRDARDAAQLNGLKRGDVVDHTKAFNHLFTIRLQDILSQGLTWAICESYIWGRGIDDKIRKCQLKLSAYSISFFVNASIGLIKTKGVPYINYPTLIMLIKEIIQFYKLNYQEIKELEKITQNLVFEGDRVEEEVLLTGSKIKTYQNADEFFSEMTNTSSSFKNLTDFFEEGFE